MAIENCVQDLSTEDPWSSTYALPLSPARQWAKENLAGYEHPEDMVNDAGVDLTLIRSSLDKTPEERLDELMDMARLTEMLAYAKPSRAKRSSRASVQVRRLLDMTPEERLNDLAHANQ